MKRTFYSFIYLFCSLFSIIPATAKDQAQSLAGIWHFALDKDNRGITEQWFKKTLQTSIALPGSCEQRGFGIKTTEPAIGRLTRIIHYEGKAWYQREFTIPKHWNGKRIELMLERCHWESNVWIDGNFYGMQNSLSVPHLYDLGSLKPGKHTLTICIDNTYKIPIGTWVHALTEDTQGNWNGIIGKIEIRATDPVWIEQTQVYQNRLAIKIGNHTGSSIQATLQQKSYTIPNGDTTIILPFHAATKLWDEFSPHINQLQLFLKAGKYSDFKTVNYACRQLATSNKQFTVNGRPTIMRGAVDECVYPLTGYPPMKTKEWLRVLKICKSYGLNYLRFHSWCPPEAAFQAADKLGFFFQVELPLWTMDAPHFGDDPERDKFITDELEKILNTYGNHPSFAFMAMGNESAGALDRLVTKGRAQDPRHLYRCENGDTQEKGDYYETGQRGIAGPRTNWNRWSSSGWIAGSDKKDSSSPTGAPVPTLSHEIGQWAMYPDFDEINKYTGTLRAYNYESYRLSLQSHNMLEQDKIFAKASGLFSVQLYKEEIEASLRTFPHGGFQLLEARDYPGQGTAIVGWLNAFWNSKGLITPKEFRHFCAPTVSLLQMTKRIYKTNERFNALAEMANYGPQTLYVKPKWTIQNEAGHVIASGILPNIKAQTGKITSLGEIDTHLPALNTATRLTVKLNIGKTSNSWNIWVYPSQPAQQPTDIHIAYEYNDETRAALKRGEKVLLFSDPTKGLYKINHSMFQPDSIRLFKVKKGQNALEGSFLPAFWNLRLFNQIGTLSILCDPHHPALKGFPTENHSDWQWADLLGNYTAAESFRTAGAPPAYCDQMEKEWGDVKNRAKAIVLNDTPKNFRPIVQVIDNYERNYKLGLIFETRVGKGKLLVCAMDLNTDSTKRPAAQQLKRSLLDYMSGKQFNPTFELSEDLLEKILTY